MGKCSQNAGRLCAQGRTYCQGRYHGRSLDIYQWKGHVRFCPNWSPWLRATVLAKVPVPEDLVKYRFGNRSGGITMGSRGGGKNLVENQVEGKINRHKICHSSFKNVGFWQSQNPEMWFIQNIILIKAVRKFNRLVTNLLSTKIDIIFCCFSFFLENSAYLCPFLQDPSKIMRQNTISNSFCPAYRIFQPLHGTRAPKICSWHYGASGRVRLTMQNTPRLPVLMLKRTCSCRIRSCRHSHSPHQWMPMYSILIL